MRIYSKSFDKVTNKENERIHALTLSGPDSLFRIDVLNTLMIKSEYQFFLAKEKGVVIGWAVAFPQQYSKEHSPQDWSLTPTMRVYLFVESSFRRQGVGKKLLKRTIKWVKSQDNDVKVYSWDSRSRGFFASCRENKYEMEVCRQ